MYLNIIFDEKIIEIYNIKRKMFEKPAGRYYVLRNGIYVAIVIANPDKKLEIKKLVIQNGKHVFLEWVGNPPTDVMLKISELKQNLSQESNG